MTRKTKKPTQYQLAKALNANQSSMSRWADLGMPTTSIDSARKWIAEHRPERVEGNAKPSGAFAAAKLRTAEATAGLKEHELSVAKGEFLPASEVVAEWQRMILTARNRMLRIPAELCDAIAAETSPAKCARLMEDRIREALTEMANYGVSNEGDTSNAE